MEKNYGYVMLLSPEDNKKLIPLIQQLSTKYVNGDIFIPHISVYNAVNTNFKEAADHIDEIIKGISRFKVATEKIHFEDKWSKTLFIKLKTNETLIKISKNLEKFYDQKYELQPHISLMYKKGLPSDIKQKISNDLNIPESFTVNSFALIDPNKKGANWHDYARWTVVYERLLEN